MDTENKIDDNKKVIEVSVVRNNILKTEQTDIKGGEKETNQALENVDYEVIAGTDNKEKGGVVEERVDKTEEKNKTAKFFKERIDVNVGDQIKQAKQAEQAIEGSKKEIKEIQKIQEEIDEKDRLLRNTDNIIEKLRGAGITADKDITQFRKELLQEENELRKKQIEIGRSLFDKYIKERIVAPLGNIEKKDIESSFGSYQTFPEYKIKYPKTVIRALENLFNEYNQSFASLVEKNREWETDYQYCMVDGKPINYCVRFDMVGLPDGFLQVAEKMPEEVVREVLRNKIFEIENSFGMYHLMEKAFSRDKEDSFLKFIFARF